MSSAPIVLVPGFWLGAWAWDEVTTALRADGHKVTALTLPGLESANADRSKISMADHVEAISEAVSAAGARVVLTVHSGAGASGYFASDRVPELIAAMVYVDTGAPKGALDPSFVGVEKSLPSLEELRANENLNGLTAEHLATFRRRAVSEPGAALRESHELTNAARLAIPSTVICTGNTCEEYKDAIKKGYEFVSGLADLHDVTYVDLPTSHWPMWSRPRELATIIGDIAKAHGSAAGSKGRR